MDRYLKNYIAEDLGKKMVFLGGPRQVGKTTLALCMLGGDESNPAYFNWDYAEDKKRILDGRLPS